MQNPFTRQRLLIRLEQGQTHAMPVRQAVRLRVRCGLVWLTMENSRIDIWLGAGRETALHGHGLAVLEAVKGCAEIEIHPLPGLWGRTAACVPAAGGARGLAGGPPEEERPLLSRLLPHGLIRW